MGIVEAAGVALLGAVAVVVLRELRAAAALPLRLAVLLLLVGGAAALAEPLLAAVRTLFSMGDGASFAPRVLRALGIALIAELTASFCRDLGESTAAEGVLLFGRVEILVLALPLLDEVLHLAGELLQF